MSSFRRTIAASSFAALSLIASTALAQGSYPSKPIRFLIPLTPGSAIDVVSRTAGTVASERLKQPLVYENRPGANTNVSTDACARAAADGYTVCLITYSISLNPFLYAKMPFDPARDIEPITNLVFTYDVLLANAAVPVRSLKELIAYAKANPGRINFGSLGVGGTPHLIPEWIARQSGVNFTHVPFKGTPEIYQALFAGDVHIVYLTLGGPGTVANIKAGKLKPLFVYSPKRHPLIPDVPTMAETGIADYQFTGWWGLGAPARTPRDVIAKLNAAFVEAVKTPVVRDRFLAMGLEPVGNSAEEFGRYMAEDRKRAEHLIRTVGAKME